MELFRKRDFGYKKMNYLPGGMIAGSEWISDIHEEPCTPTGRWKVVNKNGDIKLYLEVWEYYATGKWVVKHIERKWFKFLGKKKVKKWKSKSEKRGLWVEEDDLIYVETTINECDPDCVQA